MISATTISPLNRRIVDGGAPPFSFGNALQFDGVNDFVSFGGSNVLADPDSAWSFGGWFNLTNFDNNFPIIARLKSGVTNNPFAIFFSNNGSYSDLTFGSSSTFVRRRVSISSILGNYIHLVITYNGLGSNNDSNFTIYINGVSTATSSSGALASSPDTSRLSEAGLPYVGKQDEVAFWQQELTSGQVSNQWNGGNGNLADADVTPLVWFRMNESGTATTAVNSGSGGATYDGTLTNFPTSGMWVAH